jgi:hypothetical protein
MPHTRRPRKPDPKPQQQKRLQVTDADGWTHVTTNKNVRRALRANHSADEGQSTTPLLMPAEAPAQLTLDDLQTQFNGYRERWEGSETWRVMADTLRRRFEGSSSIADSDPSTTPLEDIVCIGLGSPSGFLRGGWVDRRSVSLYQLAALVGVTELMSKSIAAISIFMRLVWKDYSTDERTTPLIRKIPSLDHRLRPRSSLQPARPVAPQFSRDHRSRSPRGVCKGLRSVIPVLPRCGADASRAIACF